MILSLVLITRRGKRGRPGAARRNDLPKDERTKVNYKTDERRAKGEEREDGKRFKCRSKSD